MSNLLVIGDIHNKVALADNYLSRFPNTPVIFMGDYFDDFGDDSIAATITAEWLKNSLSQPNRIHLIGNHDLPYLTNGRVNCPGWTPEKNKMVNEVLSREDWNKLKFFHYEKDYYFSHGGLLRQWFGHPLTGEFTPEHVESVVSHSINNLWGGMNCDPIWAADRWRGGSNPFGGLLWCDWRALDHEMNVNQIVGHTPSNRILSSTDEELNSRHINVDCFLKQVLLLSENGIPTIINQFDVNSKKWT